MKIFKNIKIHSQEELIKLKESLKYREDNYSRYISKSRKNLDLITEMKELQRIQKDSRKVKRIIAFNNVFFGINKLIYNRESYKKRLDVISKINQEGIPKIVSLFTEKLTAQIALIDKKLARRNKLIKCIIKLSEDYK
jgi:hypothetical protein